MVPSRTDRTGNRLLASLQKKDRELLDNALEPIALKLRDVLYEVEEPIRAVYFVTSGVASIISIDADGRSIEVATIGNEGMVGIPVILGAKRTPGRAFCQVPGSALRMPAERFREALDRSPSLLAVLLRYTQSFINQLAQNASCFQLHSIDQRCARWLLMTHDRMASDDFLLTQEFLAQMMGVRRASVNTTAGVFQEAGFIRYARGRITMLDRAGLESAACECYATFRLDADRLLR
jgi:CRP-like cAMP-binding protein